MTFLAISGSLRSASSNTILLQAMGRLLTAGARMELYDGLASLPFFNPDLDIEGEPALPPVADFRDRLRISDAVVICSPEYAHGVPGVLKNALDWIVGSGELVGKPVALLNAAPRATHAHASLLEILTVMSATIVEDASVAVPVAGRGLDIAGILADTELTGRLHAAIDALVAAADGG